MSGRARRKRRRTGKLALSIRRRILGRDGNVCHYCSQHLPTHRLQVDHVVPVAVGGVDDDENLVAACKRCNSSKGSLPVDTWIEQRTREERTRALACELVKTMTKAEAAQVLGVSTRAVERHVAAGRLTASYVRGATGRVVDLDAGEVERLVAELNAPQAPAPAATAPDSPDTTSPDVDGAAIVLRSNAGTLARRQSGGGAELAQVLTALLEEVRQGATRQATTGRAVVPVEARLTLSLDEAVALSGIPRSMLRAAIASGDLAGGKVGRSIRVRREELERWVRETC